MSCINQNSTAVNTTTNTTQTQYGCCFQRCHVNTGCLAISIIHFVISSVLLTLLVRAFIDGNKYSWEAYFEMAFCSLYLAASIILLIAVKIENRTMMFTHLICQTISTSILFIVFLALIMGLKAGILDDPDHDGYNTLEEELLIVVEIFFTLALVVLETWFLTVALRSYRFLKEKQEYNGVDREEEV